MVVLPSTIASRYHNCYIDGGTSLENFGYHLVCHLDSGYLLDALQGEDVSSTKTASQEALFDTEFVNVIECIKEYGH